MKVAPAGWFGEPGSHAGTKQATEKPASEKKNVPQGLMLAAARQPNVFFIVYGPTKVSP
jgi:hypothetical protein